jgi:hypothetical protein
MTAWICLNRQGLLRSEPEIQRLTMKILIQKGIAWIKAMLFRQPLSKKFPKITPKSVADRLLQRSYFPNQRTQSDELPPIFDSNSFTYTVAKKFAGLGETKPKEGHDAVEVKLTRADGQTRITHIPHPAAYANLVLTLEKHWGEIPDIAGNPHSYIKPRMHKDGRLIIMNYTSWLVKTLGGLKFKLSQGYVVHADISSFFPSIYTHAIAWGLVGIANAKKSNKKQWFDEIDAAFQSARRKETNGVAIGPATSNIAAEILLINVDEALHKKGYRFFRYIDDYTCYTKTREEAESFIHDLSQQLSKYKLTLNMKKTEIRPLPEPEKASWILELQTLSRTLSKKMAPSEVAQFIDNITGVANRHEEQNVYKYAAVMLADRVSRRHASVTAFVALLGLCSHAPSLVATLRYFLPSNNDFHQHGLRSPLLELLNESIFFRRTDNICWLLYYMNKFGISVDQKIAREIIATRDCLPILLAYAYGDPQSKSESVAFAKKAVSAPDKHDRHAYWLLIYEMFRIGAIAKVGPEKQIFNMMNAEGVRFCTAL